jgi:hypothetical protein
MAILISFLAFVVALFSLTVSAEKFRLDLFSRRFDIYVRTVKFYQALMRDKETADEGTLTALQADFILAVRESQFLFAPESGVYDLLNRLSTASFKITGSRELPKGLSPEQVIENQKQFSDALVLWNSSIEPLEAKMAPYLNYHYVSTPSAPLAWIRDRWRGKSSI